jgi:hypothetical protein
VGNCELDSSDAGQGSVRGGGCCEHGNEPSGSVKGGECYDYLSDY